MALAVIHARNQFSSLASLILYENQSVQQETQKHHTFRFTWTFMATGNDPTIASLRCDFNEQEDGSFNSAEVSVSGNNVLRKTYLFAGPIPSVPLEVNG